MQKSLKKQAAISIIANYSGYFCAALLSFIITPIIIHSLGKAQYGVWALIMSTTGYYGLLNFGIRSALTKYISEYHAKKENEEINRLICSSFPFFLIIAVTVLFVSYLLSINFDKVFTLENLDPSLIKPTVLIVGLNIALSFALRPFDTILAGLNRFDLINIIGVSSSLVRALLIIMVLKLGYSLVAMSIVILCVDTITYCIIAIFSKKIFPSLSLKLNLVCRSSFKKLYNFGVFNFVRHFSRLILSETDLILIGIFLGASQVAIYSIATNLINYAWKIVKGIAMVVVPITSTLGALKEEKKLQKFMLFIPKYMLFAAVFIFIQFYFWGEEFLFLWLGKGFHESYIVFCVLMVARVGMMTNETMIEAATGMGHNKFTGIISGVEAISNLILSIILVKKIGILGIALGTVIPVTITRSIIIPVYCCRLVNLTITDYITRVVWPTLVSSLPCFTITYWYKITFMPSSYIGVALAILSAGFVALIFFYQFIDSEIKNPFLRKIGINKHV